LKRFLASSRRGSFEHVETPSKLNRLLRKKDRHRKYKKANNGCRDALVDDKAVVPLARTFYQQLLFSPRTINNF